MARRHPAHHAKFALSVRDHVEQRDGFRCVYCGGPGQELDHVLPVAAGGKAIRANTVMACQSCNRRKRASVDVEWLIPAFRHLLTKGESLQWLDFIPEAFEGWDR